MKNIISDQLAQQRINDLATSRNVYGEYRALRRGFVGGPTKRKYIQFLRDDRGLLGLEVSEAIRLLEIIKASHKCVAARTNASLLLRGIKRGREIFDEHPLISEIGKRGKSAVIHIHDAVVLEIVNSIRAASRDTGGRDD
jgi:hypothetical protein